MDNRRSPPVATAEYAVSTFSLDTDRTSYNLALGWAREGLTVDPDSVRAEEWINSFVRAAVDLADRQADRLRRERSGAYNYIVLFSDGGANVKSADPFAILRGRRSGGR